MSTVKAYGILKVKNALVSLSPTYVVQSIQFVMLFSIRTNTETYKLKLKNRIYIIPAQSSLLFVCKFKWNLKATEIRVWLVQSLRMGPSGQSL